jgi:hypothetical protein
VIVALFNTLRPAHAKPGVKLIDSLGSWRAYADVLLCIGLVAQGGCKADTPRGAPPRAASMQAAERKTLVEASAARAQVASSKPRNRLLQSTVVWTRGGPSGKGIEEFGRLIDGALDADLNVYLLDRSTSTIVVLDSLGHYLRTIGRSGRGPGELSDPLALLHDDAHTLFVLDNVNGVQAFDTRAAPIAASRSIRLPLSAQDICLYGDHLIAYGSLQGHSIHEIDKDGSLLKSFGDYLGPKQHPQHLPAFNDIGKVACFPKQGIVISTTLFFGQVRAFRVSDGTVLWTDSVPGFVAWTVLTTPASYSIGPSVSSGADKQYVLRPLDSVHVVAQSRRWEAVTASQSAGDSVEVVKTCVLNIRRPGCLVAGVSYPAIVSSRSGMSLTLQEDEYWNASLAKVRLTRSP